MTCANCERRKASERARKRRYYLKRGDYIRAKNLASYHERRREQREGS